MTVLANHNMINEQNNDGLSLRFGKNGAVTQYSFMDKGDLDRIGDIENYQQKKVFTIFLNNKEKKNTR